MARNQFVNLIIIAVCSIFGHNGLTWAQEGMNGAQINYTELEALHGLFADQTPA